MGQSVVHLLWVNDLEDTPQSKDDRVRLHKQNIALSAP